MPPVAPNRASVGAAGLFWTRNTHGEQQRQRAGQQPAAERDPLGTGRLVPATVEEAAQISRYAVKTIHKKVSEGHFPNAQKYKVHTFRHAFASMCARNQVSYKYALDWMGHKSSDKGGARFMICTDAAAEGINIQFCWLMVNYDVPWNPAR